MGSFEGSVKREVGELVEGRIGQRRRSAKASGGGSFHAQAEGPSYIPAAICVAGIGEGSTKMSGWWGVIDKNEPRSPRVLQ